MSIFNMVYSGNKLKKWTPDPSRTLLYLPLESDATDMSGNNRNTSTSGITYTTVGGVASAHCGTTGGISVGPEGFISATESKQTVSFLYYSTISNTNKRRNLFEWRNENVSFSAIVKENTTNYDFGYIWGSQTITFTANEWNLITITGDATAFKFYKNGVLLATKAGSSTPRRNGTYTSQKSQIVGCGRDGASYGESMDGNMRELIFENIVWTEDDVSNYWQFIKNKLGI